MKERTFNSSSYRYSHNGHEREDELFEGAQSAEYWMYDSRLGRRWERDPIIKDWESPYATFGNNPIYYSDPFGLDKNDWYQNEAGDVIWQEGSASSIEVGGQTYKNIGATYFETQVINGVSTIYENYQNNVVGIYSKDVDYSALLEDDVLDKALKWMASKQGKWYEGRNGEGNEWIKKFEIGIRAKVSSVDVVQGTVEAKCVSTHEDHASFVFEVKGGANQKFVIYDPVKGVLKTPVIDGEILSPAIESFIKISTSEETDDDYIIPTTVPLNLQGAYLKINNAINIKDKTYRTQSIEIGFQLDPGKLKNMKKLFTNDELGDILKNIKVESGWKKDLTLYKYQCDLH